jgi:type I restriction enzyme S subunit
MNAIQTLLTEHIDIWTAADTGPKSGRGRSSANAANVYGIRKLRELIFELAALGRLVDEDIHQPAKLVQLGEIAEFVMGQAPPGSECNTNGLGTIFVKTGEFGSQYPEVCEWTTKPLKFAKTGDVLICVVGATVGKLNLAIDCAIGRSVAAIRPVAQLDTKYIYFALMPFTLRLRAQSRGSAQGVIGKAELNAVQIRLPSLAEQHRIVAKVDELMALCDQLETQHNNATEAHEELVSYLLGTLTQSQSAADFSANWQRIAAHFDILFTTEASIDALKKTLLQLAVMGKLVPQDSNDEPASELLTRIQAEKAKLIAEVKIKQDKPLSLITNGEKPFELPQGWRWVRLNELLRKIGAGSTPLGGKQVYVNEGVPFLRSQNVWDEGLRLDDVAFITSETHQKMSGTHVCAGDLLFNITGASIGRCAIVPVNFETGNVSQHVTIVRPVSNEILLFLHLVLISRHVQQTVMDVQVGVSREGLSIGKLGQFVIPIPPISEQQRIVARVDELMSLCDQLKTRINRANQLQKKLADVVVEQAVA